VTVSGTAIVKATGNAYRTDEAFNWIPCAIVTDSGTVTVRGGAVTATGICGTAIRTDSGEVKIIGGTVSSTGDYYFEDIEDNYYLMVPLTIINFYGDITVSGGTVSAAGDAAIAIYTAEGKINVSGGTVSATGDDFLKIIDDHSRFYNRSVAILTERGDLSISGGNISASGEGGRAIQTVDGNIMVSGNATIQASGRDSHAIATDSGKVNVTVTGGRVLANNEGGIAIITYGNVTVTGGIVEATGEYGAAIITAGDDSITKITGGVVRGDTAIAINYGGVAAYLAGTCIGDFFIYENLGQVVEVASLNAGAAGTTTGLTTKAGAVSAKWAAGGNIEFTLGEGLPVKTLWWSYGNSSIQLGDVTGDGSINMQDVLMIYQHFRGKLTLTADEFLRADVNRDSLITMQDVLLVYQYFRGKITDFLP